MPYHELITTNARFWNASGVRLDLGASGIAVETGSLEALLTNGVTFGMPEAMPAGERVTERGFFDIYPTYSRLQSALQNRRQLRHLD